MSRLYTGFGGVIAEVREAERRGYKVARCKYCQNWEWYHPDECQAEDLHCSSRKCEQRALVELAPPEIVCMSCGGSSVEGPGLIPCPGAERCALLPPKKAVSR